MSETLKNQNGESNHLVGIATNGRMAVLLTAVLGVITILGFLLHLLYSWEGQMLLDVDTNLDIVQVDHDIETEVKKIRQLPFYLRLNEFSSTSRPDYRILLKELEPEGNPHSAISPHSLPFQQNSNIISSFALKKDKIYQVKGTDVNFRLNEFFPNFGFKYDYPTNIDTIAPEDPGIMLELIIGTDRPQLQLRANQHSSVEEPHLNTTIEFSWEMPGEINVDLLNLESGSVDSSLEKIVFVGKSKEVIYLFSEWAFKENLERGRTYQFPGRENMGFVFQFIFPDAKFIKSTLASLNDELDNPVAKIEVWNVNEYGSEYVFLYPDKGGAIGKYRIPGTRKILELGDQSQLEYVADISIVNSEGVVAKQFQIGPSTTSVHEGYKFSQIQGARGIDNYPGLSVSKKFGTPLIYIGLGGFLLSWIGIWYQSKS